MMDFISIIFILLGLIMSYLILKLSIVSRSIADILRKNPKIYYKTLFFYPHKNLSFSENAEITYRKIIYQFKLTFLLQSLIKRRFNEIFDELMNIPEIRKLKNKKLDDLINRQRKITRIIGVIVNLFFNFLRSSLFTTFSKLLFL